MAGRSRLGGRRHVEPEDVGARHHDLGDRGLAQLEHAVDHLALFALDQPS